MEKTFRLGILIGRFQTLHLGHEDMIRRAFSLCERVAVFVGSSQESGTAKNPYSFEMRRDVLRAVFGEKLEVYPLPDIGVGNCPAWGEYVLGQVVAACGEAPDLVVTGKEEARKDWFPGPDGRGVCELVVPKTVDICASTLRGYLLEGEEDKWRAYTNPALWDRFDEMRSLVIASADNTFTRSM